MASMKDEAKAYKPPQTLNIADLGKVSVDLDLKQSDKQKDSEGKEFTYKYIEVDGQEYRVPNRVLAGIKAILEKRPTLKFVSVIKQGQGMNTRYNVIPAEE